jgi:hypothetical protein
VTATPSRSLRRRGTRFAAIAAASALLLTGCAAGQRAATANEVPVIDGVTASIGQIDLRNVTILTPPKGSYAAGSDADLQVYLVNNGQPDKLVSVSSSSAASVEIFSSQADADAAASSPSASATDDATPSDSASPSDTSAPASSSAVVDLASGQLTRVGSGGSAPVIVIKGLTAALYPAMSIPLVFTFANAGTGTVWVSVHLSTTGVTAPTLPVSTESDGG